jgi:hypothetical protein
MKETTMTHEIDRRAAIAGTLGFAAIAAIPVEADAATRAAIDTGDPRAMMMILAKLQGDVSGRTHYKYKRGQIYGLTNGQGLPIDRYGHRLYDYEGGVVGRSRILANGDVETKSRSWVFYTDPKTGDYMTTWRNPMTGKDVPVKPFRAGISGGTLTANGPKVEANFEMQSSVVGRPTTLEFVTMGDQTWVSRHAFTRWTPKGATMARTEFTLDTWVVNTRDLQNQRLTKIPSIYSWTSQTEWQTWLQMPADQPGQQLWHLTSGHVDRLAQLPGRFVAESNRAFPGILTEPLVWAA